MEREGGKMRCSINIKDDLDGAIMPRSTELPDDLKMLVRRNALRISDTSFEDDCRRLVFAIKEALNRHTTKQPDREPMERLDGDRLKREVDSRERSENEAKVLNRRIGSIICFVLGFIFVLSSGALLFAPQSSGGPYGGFLAFAIGLFLALAACWMWKSTLLKK